MDIEKTMEFILAQQATAEAEMAAMREHQREMQEQHRKAGVETAAQMTEIRIMLKEVLVVQKAQAKGLVRVEASVERLSKAQEVTERRLQGLIDALRRGGNGNPKR